MAQVSVSVNGKAYNIACDDGQEAHLERLAAYIDKRVGELVASVGRQIGDQQLLMMASLLVADELSDVYKELNGLRGGNDVAALSEAMEVALCDAMDALADRIERIAERVEAT